MTGVVLLAHGAGSSPDVALRLLAGAWPVGAAPLAIDARGPVDDLVARLHEAALGRRVVLAAGISLGAHAVARWALAGGAAEELLLAMPAWTGLPGAVAGLTTASAGAVAARGRAAVLAEIASDPGLRDDWVLEELARGWSTYTDGELATALHQAAGSPAPTLEDLARITTRTAVVALDDDPLHPASVARDWAAAIPCSALVVVPRDGPGAARGALGAAGRRALDRLSGSR